MATNFTKRVSHICQEHQYTNNINQNYSIFSGSTYDIRNISIILLMFSSKNPGFPWFFVTFNIFIIFDTVLHGLIVIFIRYLLNMPELVLNKILINLLNCV